MPIPLRIPTQADVLSALRELEVPIGAILDVGVNYQTESLKQAFPNLKHHLFEPVASYFPHIEKNYYKIPHQLYPVALSNADGNAFLASINIYDQKTNPEGLASHSYVADRRLTKEEEPQLIDCQEIQRLTLDSALKGVRAPTKPYLLKIDVDGHELPILEGATETLKNCSVVIIEATIQNLAERLNFMISRGFRLFDMVDISYYAGTLWQVDMVLIPSQIMKASPKLRPSVFDQPFRRELWHSHGAESASPALADIKEATALSYLELVEKSRQLKERLLSQMPLELQSASSKIWEEMELNCCRLANDNTRLQLALGAARVQSEEAKFSFKHWEEPVFNFLANIIRKTAPYQWGTLGRNLPIPYRPEMVRRPKLQSFPSFAIVTPSLNQGKYIGDTIKSIICQEYPNLQYHVQDGASTDNSLAVVSELAAKYHFTFESKPDKCHSQALNRGFDRVSGEIMGFVNSDDLLCPDSLFLVADYFNRHPEVDVVYGHRYVIDKDGQEVGRWYMPKYDQDELRYLCTLPQETCFWRRRAWEKAGGFIDESLLYALDWDLWLRLRASGAKFARIPHFLGCFRVQPEQKTATNLETIGKQDTVILQQREFHGRLPRNGRVQFFADYTIVRSFLTQVFGGIF